MNQNPKVLLIMPSTHRDKQLELLLSSSMINFEVIAIKSDSDFILDVVKEKAQRLSVLNLKNSALSIILNYFRVRKIVKRFQPRMVESHGLLPGLLSTLLCFESNLFRTMSVKFVHFRHHNLNHHLQRNRAWLIIDKIIFKAHDLIVVPSRQTQSVLIAEGCRENKICVMPHKIDPEKISKYVVDLKKFRETQTKKVRIIAVGRIDWQKDYELLLRSIAYLRRTHTNFEVKIFGYGSQDQVRTLVEAIEDRNLESFVEICGWTPEIEYEMSISDIFLHTSRDESYGLVLAETLLLGIPIVSTWAGGASDLLVYHGRPPCLPSPKSLGTELIWVMENLAEAKASSIVRREVFLARMNSYDLDQAHLSLVNVDLRDLER
jgi:glycosyltransferase involved in cell wall biosynthesis